MVLRRSSRTFAVKLSSIVFSVRSLGDALNPLQSKGCCFSINSWVLYGSPGEIRTPVDGSLPGFGVQSPSLARSFSTLASPLHHRATRDPGPGLSPNKPSAQRTIVGANETVSFPLYLTCPRTSKALRISLNLEQHDGTRG